MRVQMLPADFSGCRYYRIQLPHDYIDDDDVFINDEITAARHKDNGVIGDAVPHDPEVDVIVIQRPTKRAVYETIPYLQANGVAVVVELDDDIQNVPRENYAWQFLHSSRDPDNNASWTLKAARMADWVTVSTPALADIYGKHGRCTVIHNYINDAWMDSEPEDLNEKVVVGWTGNTGNHPFDLSVVKSFLREIIEDNDAFGYVIGGSSGFRELGFDGTMADFCEWVIVEEYPGVVAGLDVGVVPLHDSKFNESKSWLKGLEYASQGVPFVASPIDEYVRLSEKMDGVVLAGKQKHWRKRLEFLINTDTREEIGEGLREQVRERFLVSQHVHEYMEAWERALEHRRSKVSRKRWPGWVGKTPNVPFDPMEFARREVML